MSTPSPTITRPPAHGGCIIQPPARIPFCHLLRFGTCLAIDDPQSRCVVLRHACPKTVLMGKCQPLPPGVAFRLALGSMQHLTASGPEGWLCSTLMPFKISD